jgi:pimeloyl-ACP methyl ester carboxylesterase
MNWAGYWAHERRAEAEAALNRQSDPARGGRANIGQGPSLVLLHGSAHTSKVWGAVQQHLSVPSIAVDIPGRRDRPGVLAKVTVAESVSSVLTDLEQVHAADLILVAHSSSGVVLPAIAAALGSRVAQLIFVAGLCAPEGDCAVDLVAPDRRDQMWVRLEQLRNRYPRHMLGIDMDGLDIPAGYALLTDQREALGVESLNRLFQPVSWLGVPERARRVFVRCLADPIQPPALQNRLIDACRAGIVADIASGHTPAIDAPVELARLLNSLTRRWD